MNGALRVEVEDDRGVARAREAVRDALRDLDEGLVQSAELITSELVTNAILHGGGVVDVTVTRTNGVVRIGVTDRSRAKPMMGLLTPDGMTGRGLTLVGRLSKRWGVDAAPEGKVVWAEVDPEPAPAPDIDAAELLATWGDDWDADDAVVQRHHVSLGEVPTRLLVSAKAHVDNLVREFSLAARGEQQGVTSPLPTHLVELLTTVVNEFSEARQSIKQQATKAARRGEAHTVLELDLPRDAADAAVAYLAALDEIDAYCRATRLLTLETPPQHRLFRRWYVEELVRQLRAAGSDDPVSRVQPFEERLLDEIESVAEAQRASDRAARLYSVAVALSAAATPEEVADAVLTEGVAALGASGGGLLLAATPDRLTVPGTVGYDPDVVEGLRTESPSADLPAAVALRTKRPVWLESQEERDAQFPELVGLESKTISMCAVPLVTQDTALGAMRFSFTQARLFDEDERRFVLALAAETAQSLHRAQLQDERASIAHRLQQSLLPPRLPDVAGIDIAALYRAAGDGMEIGGDFYDVWQLSSDRWAFVIGDVTGSGPEAAGLAALVRYTLRGVAMLESDPGAVMSHVNTALHAYLAASDDDARFCTALLGIVELGHPLVLHIASGGHPDPIVRRADGSTGTIEVRGSLLGVLPDAEICVQTLTLEPGDAVVTLTDGVLDARTGDGVLDVHGVTTAIGPAGSATAIVDSIEQALTAAPSGGEGDDAAVLVIRAV